MKTGFTRASAQRFPDAAFAEYAAGIIEGHFNVPDGITVTGSAYGWKSDPPFRGIIIRYAMMKPLWRVYSVEALREKLRDVVEIAGADEPDLKPEEITVTKYSERYLKNGYIFGSTDKSGKVLHHIGVYDLLYLKRKPWKVKSLRHLDYLLSTAGIRRVL